MLGDACHPMLPFMGQGGAQAIEDAAALTACMLRCGDEVEALKLYEEVRLPRASQIQTMSWENKSRFHMPDGPGQVERDAAMAEGTTDWSYRAIAWLYGHDADILPVAAPSAH
jgi:salicylate hydroxylase